MKINVFRWFVLILLLCWALGSDEEDPGPDPDDDPEGDCMKFHNCYGGGQWGYCLQKKGHNGQHLCAKCLTYFSEDDE